MSKVNLVVFGVPNGFNQSRCEQNMINFLQLFYNGDTGGMKFRVTRRSNGEVHYVFLVYPNHPNEVFLDYNGRSGSFFGISLYLRNEYFINPEKICKILQTTYNNYIKNKIIKETPKLRQFLVPKLNYDDDKIANYVAQGLQKTILQNPEFNLNNDIRPLPPIQNQSQRD